MESEPATLLTGVKRLVDLNHFHSKARVVLAVSGGCDSMFLLALYKALFSAGLCKHKPLVYHLNHRLRGRESQLDAELVASHAAAAGLECIVETRAVAKFARRSGLNLEAAGRHLRYRNLYRICRRYNLDCAVTGHHADDYLESLLLHLLRGGGPTALNTMPLYSVVEGVSLFRPLLLLKRDDIRSLAEKFKIEYREDSSNQSDDFLRNRLRLSLAPLLEDENIDPVTTWRNFHPGFAEDDLIPTTPPATHLALDRQLLTHAPPEKLKFLFDAALAGLGFPPSARGLYSEIYKQIKEDRINFQLRITTPRLLIWSARRGPVWLFRKNSPYLRPFQVRTLESDSVVVKYGGQEKEYRLKPEEQFIAWRSGLRSSLFNAQGERCGSRKLKSIFQELALPAPLRENIPLVYDSQQQLVVRICLSFWENRGDLSFR